MKELLILVVFFCIYHQFSFAESCFPKQQIKYGVKAFSEMPLIIRNSLTEKEFNEVLEQFSAFWKPIIKSKYDKELQLQGKWSEDHIDARSTRDMQNNPIIIINGGLAKHPEMTKNGLFLILCHELGHHFGGAPKLFRGRSKLRSWSSAEGQADYYATSKCMPKMIDADLMYENSKEVNSSKCRGHYCREIISSALSVGKVFASLKMDWQDPSPSLSANYKQSATFYGHPEPQCRFDTYIAGSLCTDDTDKDFDNSDYRPGACAAETYPDAARPGCWFSSSQY